MFVFLFEHVKLRSIIIIGGTNEHFSACSNNRTNTNNLKFIFESITVPDDTCLEGDLVFEHEWVNLFA